MEVEESLVHKRYPYCTLCYSNIYTIPVVAIAKHLSGQLHYSFYSLFGRVSGF